jgi:hypothetical protein
MLRFRCPVRQRLWNIDNQLFSLSGAKIMNEFGVVKNLGEAAINVATGDGKEVLSGVLKAASSAADGGIIGNVYAEHIAQVATGETPPTMGDINVGLDIIDSLGNQDGVTDVNDIGDIIGGIIEGIRSLFS